MSLILDRRGERYNLVMGEEDAEINGEGERENIEIPELGEVTLREARKTMFEVNLGNSQDFNTQRHATKQHCHPSSRNF